MENVKLFSYQQMLVNKKNQVLRLICLLLILLIVVFVLSMNSGFIRLSPWEVTKTFLGFGNHKQELILYAFRLPRILIAILIGAGLSVSGAIIQGVSRNPLADPGILGINAGAGLAVVTFILFFKDTATQSIFLLPLVALLGGLIAAILIYTLSRKSGAVSTVRIILVGIGIGMLFKALILLLEMKMEYHQYVNAAIWLAGSIWGSNWQFVLVLLPWILILLPYAFSKASILNIINLGEQNATGLGVEIEREKFLLSGMAVALASACVSISGGIAFVGLISPHLARLLVGPRHEYLLPVAAVLGAMLLLIADLFARQLLSPNEIPIGIVVAVIGAPYFLYLLAKSTG